MSGLAVAVEKRMWPLVALYLLVGVAEAAAVLPPDALEGLLDVLEGRPRRGRR